MLGNSVSIVNKLLFGDRVLVRMKDKILSRKTYIK
jgi:hypothetical protein